MLSRQTPEMSYAIQRQGQQDWCLCTSTLIYHSRGGMARRPTGAYQEPCDSITALCCLLSGQSWDSSAGGKLSNLIMLPLKSSCLQAGVLLDISSPNWAMEDHTYSITVHVCLPVIYSKLGKEFVTAYSLPSHTQIEAEGEEGIDEWHLKEATLCRAKHKGWQVKTE